MDLSCVKPQWQQLIQKVIDITFMHTGIQLDNKNFSMIEARLMKRFYTLRLSSPQEYLNYINTCPAQECKYIISALTTHHTSFFREHFHFQDIENKHLENILIAKEKNTKDKTVRIWSSACSQGQECFSLSMFFYKLKLQNNLKHYSYEILGTDVDSESIEFAKNGVYFYRDLMQSPEEYIKGNWQRGSGDLKDFVRPKPHIKSPLNFEVANLLDLKDKYRGEKFDIIFCRNVLIYFQAEQIKIIIQSLLERLSPYGMLVLGISESILGLDLPVKLLSNNIYTHVFNVDSRFRGYDKASASGNNKTSAPGNDKAPFQFFSQSLVPLSNRNKKFIIAIGASTGGTEAIQFILKMLPKNIPPIVIVQHIPAGFSKAFAQRLSKELPFQVVEASHDESLKENCVYIAPGDEHMEIKQTNGLLKIKLHKETKRNSHRPSVDVLFESLIGISGRKIISLILTGMGNDGAYGMKQLKNAGAKTIAQDEKSSVVFGMPNEAIKLGGVDYVEPLEKIAKRLIALIEPQ